MNCCKRNLSLVEKKKLRQIKEDMERAVDSKASAEAEGATSGGLTNEECLAQIRELEGEKRFVKREIHRGEQQLQETRANDNERYASMQKREAELRGRSEKLDAKLEGFERQERALYRTFKEE